MFDSMMLNSLYPMVSKINCTITEQLNRGHSDLHFRICQGLYLIHSAANPTLIAYVHVHAGLEKFSDVIWSETMMSSEHTYHNPNYEKSHEN